MTRPILRLAWPMVMRVIIRRKPVIKWTQRFVVVMQVIRINHLVPILPPFRDFITSISSGNYIAVDSFFDVVPNV